MNDSEITELLYSALRQPPGTEVETSDFERLRAKLYSVKRKLADPALDVLSFTQCPTDPNLLWIIHSRSK